MPRRQSIQPTAKLPSPEVQGAQRVAIIGAGPTGLEAAHYALRCGCVPRLFESSSETAPVVRAVQHVGLFAPWAALRTAVGESVLAASDSSGKPRGNVYPTGADYLRRYIDPLAVALPPKTLWLNHRVVGIARAYLSASELPGEPELRAQRPFRILTRNTATGEERAWNAEYVLDCTSEGEQPAWIGAGGLPAIGEMGSSHKIDYRPPDVLGVERSRFALKKTLLVGSDILAAVSATALAELAQSQHGTQFYWAWSSDLEVPFDSSRALEPRLQVLLRGANLLIKSAVPYLAHSSRTHVDEIRFNVELQRFLATLQVDKQTKRFRFDNVIAATGSRRESAYIRQLPPGEPGIFDLGSGAEPLAVRGNLRLAHSSIRDAFRVILCKPFLDLYSLDSQ